MPKRKLTEEEIKENKVERKVKSFMKVVRKKNKKKNGGEVAPEWECSLMMLEVYYEQFYELYDYLFNLKQIDPKIINIQEIIY